MMKCVWWRRHCSSVELALNWVESESLWVMSSNKMTTATQCLLVSSHVPGHATCYSSIIISTIISHPTRSRLVPRSSLNASQTPVMTTYSTWGSLNHKSPALSLSVKAPAIIHCAIDPPTTTEVPFYRCLYVYSSSIRNLILCGKKSAVV